MDLSIIIISYNTRDIAKKCLETIFDSLKGSKMSTEIIVVDNNSSDGSVEMLKVFQRSNVKRQMSKVEIIESKENLGFAKGNNKAAKQAEGQYLLFLNSDIEVLDDALPKLYNYFVSEDNQFDFVGGKLLEADGKTPQPSCGPFYSLPVAFAALFLRADYYHLTRYSPETIKEVDWVSGACIMCRKANFEKIGGFDEKIFMYMDEIDLLYRAKKKGLRVGFFNQARFVHLGSASSGSRTQPILQVYRGFLYFYKKHHSRLQISVLRFMLQLKALISLYIGKIIRNDYLIETYAKAFQITKDDR